MRASNLQELVYKRGQAGISKASVTIVFNNERKEKSPIGFEDSPTISVTRQVCGQFWRNLRVCLTMLYRSSLAGGTST